MSIYSTYDEFTLAGHLVHVQGVNGEIRDDGPIWGFLSPATRGGYEDVRDVFVVCCCTGKGTKRNGQEYVDPLMHMSYADWLLHSATPRSRRLLKSRLRTRLKARDDIGAAGRATR